MEVLTRPIGLVSSRRSLHISVPRSIPSTVQLTEQSCKVVKARLSSLELACNKYDVEAFAPL